MGDTITLPGAIPGLLRRGSPVLAVWGEESIDDGEYSTSGVVLRIDPPTASQSIEIAHCGWDDGDIDPTCAADTLYLDLTDATGRAHAAWWLADTLDLRRYSTDWYGRFPGERCWSLGAEHSWHGSDDDTMSGLRSDELVPSLADLDPNDPTLLPDGSRRVDAEALRRVVLHAAGIAT